MRSFRITTWNVNGIRAVLGRNGLVWISALQPDVVCLQETKARPEQIQAGLAEILEGSCAGYHRQWLPAERPGYSGVATFSRCEPLSIQAGLGETRFDSEGRVLISRHPGFLLFNVYFPSGQSGDARVRFKLEFYAKLLEVCNRLHAGGERIVICGDFNTAHQEIDLRYPKANKMTSGFLPEERAWVDRYLAGGFVDAFRALYPDRIQYTWWTYRMGAREKNVGWRLDYFLVSSELMPAVSEVKIHNEIMGSDHCPVSLVFASDSI